MLRGWHANNGAALGDLRLGFVCTKQSVDGQDGLEGYYCQYDHPLELIAVQPWKSGQPPHKVLTLEYLVEWLAGTL